MGPCRTVPHVAATRPPRRMGYPGFTQLFSGAPCILAFHPPSSFLASMRGDFYGTRFSGGSKWSGYEEGRGRLEQIRASDPDSARWSRLLKPTLGSHRRHRPLPPPAVSHCLPLTARSLPAVDLPTFAGEHDDYDPDDDVCGDAIYVVQEGLQEFVDTCTATAIALRNLENGLRALGQLRSGSAPVPPPVTATAACVRCCMHSIECLAAWHATFVSPPPANVQALSPLSTATQRQALRTVVVALAAIGRVVPFGSCVSGLHVAGGDLDLSLEGRLTWCGCGAGKAAVLHKPRHAHNCCACVPEADSAVSSPVVYCRQSSWGCQPAVLCALCRLSKGYRINGAADELTQKEKKAVLKVCCCWWLESEWPWWWRPACHPGAALPLQDFCRARPLACVCTRRPQLPLHTSTHAPCSMPRQCCGSSRRRRDGCSKSSMRACPSSSSQRAARVRAGCAACGAGCAARRKQFCLVRREQTLQHGHQSVTVTHLCIPSGFSCPLP